MSIDSDNYFKKTDSPTLYFVDGYHGGIKGHMGPGTMSDVLNGLDNIPDWKVSLDVEPISFDWLKKHEPETFYRLKEYVEASYDEARVEIVSGTHAQPFPWAISGESTFRQLILGLKYVRESFPKAVVDTYSVQEPCWTSALPQMLDSLGFKRAVLKNSTCWGGYTKGVDKEILFWLGPDGTRIACVPRYECESLIFCWAIQGSGYDKSALDVFAQKCLDNGIRHPVGVEFQDLGWRGLPWVNEKYQRYTTWREYFNKIADKPTEDWKFSQEDILVNIPWGEKTLNRMSRQVRQSENKIISAEKLAALAAVKAGYVYPEEKFESAWYQLLLSQHHDAWICAPAGQWAKRAEFQTTFSDTACDEITDDALYAISVNEITTDTKEKKAQYVRVYNTSGQKRRDLVEINLTVPEGTESLDIYSPEGEKVTVQAVNIRRYRGNKISFRTAFVASVPAFGFATYSVVPKETAAEPQSGISVIESESELIIESDIYKLVVDLEHGGTFSSLYDKRQQKELVDKGSDTLFNEIKGYFISEGKYLSTRDVKVRARVWEQGPVKVTAMLEGELCGQFFKTFISLTQGCEAIGVYNQFFFKNVQIGEPREIPQERRNLEYKKADHDDRYKLHALFPVSFKGGEIYKESAYNVEKSRLDDTFFSGWNSIKHKVLLHWVDEYSESENSGLAIYCDHTNSYLFGKDYPLGLTLAYGGQSGFWWGNCVLDGMQETRYSIIPHAGKWDDAKLYSRFEEINEPFVSRTFCTNENIKVEKAYSALELLTPGVVLSSVTADKNRLLVRVYNAEGADGDIELQFGFEAKSVTAVSPDGTPVKSIPFTVDFSHNKAVIRNVPRFGIRTAAIEF